MRYFLHTKDVTLDQEKFDAAHQFAIRVTPTTDYSDTHQHNENKVLQDHFFSKLSEEAVKIVFTDLGHTVVGPDYQIYPGKEKSWDYDLYIDRIGLAVKSQGRSLARKFGLSWSFQESPRRDIILDDPNGWVCFVEVNDSIKNFPCVVYPPYQISELIFREPKKRTLMGKKKVVYARDLKNLE